MANIEKFRTGLLSISLVFAAGMATAEEPVKQGTAPAQLRKVGTDTIEPVIQGDNLYAPELVRNGEGWNCYYGGWKTTGQLYDRIYLGTTSGSQVNTSWTEEMIITNGAYRHVNDPTVYRKGNVWTMLYTAARDVGSDGKTRYRDWINYSTSTNGRTWTPGEGSTSTEIVMTDPDNLLKGEAFSDIARPSLVRDGSQWRLWFDGKINSGSMVSYQAISSDDFPSRFRLIHVYPNLAGFPSFMEPDVALRPNGSYIAVVQTGFKRLMYGTSADGVNFTLYEVLNANSPNYTRKWVSNPGMIYDDVSDDLLGFAFGMTDDDAYMNHDIGFSPLQPASPK